jgi:GTP-binding protein
MPPLDIEDPTVSMFFLVNTGPFSGQEGNAIRLRPLKERLERELHTNVGLRMEDLGRSDGVKVSGRGELHLAILIEEMRREGLEFCVSRPEVIIHRNDKGHVMEPMDVLIIDVPEEFQGVVVEKVARRKGRLINVKNSGHGTVQLEYLIPTRGLIGYRSEFLTDTRGLGIMTSRYTRHGPWAGDMVGRNRGSMVSMHTGPATAYSLENLQGHGTLFVAPMERVYAGMIVGKHSRAGDLPCNPTKKKHLSAHRSATREIDVRLEVPLRMLLEPAIEWIADDELVEVTPKSVRLRKAILDVQQRRRAKRKTDEQKEPAT